MGEVALCKNGCESPVHLYGSCRACVNKGKRESWKKNAKYYSIHRKKKRQEKKSAIFCQTCEADISHKRSDAKYCDKAYCRYKPNEYMGNQRRKARHKVLFSCENSRKRYTKKDNKIVLNLEKSITEVGQKLGRSYRAIAIRRLRLLEKKQKDSLC